MTGLSKNIYTKKNPKYGHVLTVLKAANSLTIISMSSRSSSSVSSFTPPSGGRPTGG